MTNRCGDVESMGSGETEVLRDESDESKRTEYEDACSDSTERKQKVEFIRRVSAGEISVIDAADRVCV